MPMPITPTGYGNKYDPSLSRPRIAERIREDIKAAQQLPTSEPLHLPKSLRVTVRCHQRGQTITLTVRKHAGHLINPAAVVADAAIDDYETRREISRRTKEGARIEAVLEHLAHEYNFDKSDSQSDYFHVNFYLRVDFETDTADRLALLQEHAALISDLRITLHSGHRSLAREQLATVDEGHTPIGQRMAIAALFHAVD